MTFFKITNKPFHFLFVFIFICTATKPIFASPTESSKPISTERDELVLGDKDSQVGTSIKNIKDIDDMANLLLLKDIQEPMASYCQQENKEDALCDLLTLSLELDQRKSDKNWLIAKVAYATALGTVLLGITAPAAGTILESLLLNGTGSGIAAKVARVAGVAGVAGVTALAILLIFSTAYEYKDFELAKKDIASIRQELRDTLASTLATEDDSFKGEQLIDNPMP